MSTSASEVGGSWLRGRGLCLWAWVQGHGHAGHPGVRPTLDKSYWTHGYVLISKEVEDCVPVFLKHIAHDVYVCGKTINLLKLCCPRVRRGSRMGRGRGPVFPGAESEAECWWLCLHHLWQHYLCWSDVPVPRISVIFSLEELKEIEKDCAVYVGRMERVARHSSVSKEEKVRGTSGVFFAPPLLPGVSGWWGGP